MDRQIECRYLVHITTSSTTSRRAPSYKVLCTMYCVLCTSMELVQVQYVICTMYIVELLVRCTCTWYIPLVQDIDRHRLVPVCCIRRAALLCTWIPCIRRYTTHLHLYMISSRPTCLIPPHGDAANDPAPASHQVSAHKAGCEILPS